MTDTSINQILGQIEELRTYFRNCRAYFPSLKPSAEGSTHVFTAPYYVGHGFPIRFEFENPLSAEDIARNNQIAHWINQNAIVRLCALMEYHSMFSKEIRIDQNVDGWRELDLARRLRQIFAHKSGRYSPDISRERTLIEEVISYFDLDIQNPSDYPLDIDKVIDPIFEGCKRYVQGKLRVV